MCAEISMRTELEIMMKKLQFIVPFKLAGLAARAPRRGADLAPALKRGLAKIGRIARFLTGGVVFFICFPRPSVRTGAPSLL